MIDNKTTALGLDDSDKDIVKAPFQELARRTADGDITSDQMKQIVGSLSVKPSSGVILTRGFQHRFLAQSDLTAEEQVAAITTCHRFSQALSQSLIAHEEAESLQKLVLLNPGTQHVKLKEALSQAEIRECLQLMEQAADRAGIPAGAGDINLAELIDRDINAILSELQLAPLSTPQNNGMISATDIQQIFRQHGFPHLAILPVPLPQAADAFAKRQAILAQDGVGDMQWLLRNAALRADPQHILSGVQSVIVTLLPYHPEAWDQDQLRRARYASGKDYHQLLRKKIMQAGKELADTIGTGHHTIRATVDSAPVDERSLAILGELGWLGKNGLVLHPQRGSYHFLGELWCAFPLPEISGGSGDDRCGSCQACHQACPTQALVGRRVLSERCISYLTIEHQGVIPRHLAKQCAGWWFGCDRCQEVCPWNKFALPAGDSRLLGRDDQRDHLLQITANEFDDYFAGSAVRRIGYQRFRRNLLVALFSLQQDHSTFANDPCDLVQAQWQELYQSSD